MRNTIKEMIINSLISDGILEGKSKISEALDVRYGFEFGYKNYCGDDKKTAFNTSQIIVKAENNLYTISINEKTDLNMNDVSFEQIEKIYSAKVEQKRKEEMFRLAKEELTKMYQEKIKELKKQFDIQY